MARPPTLAFLRTESGAGLVLAIAALAALILANSPYAGAYFNFTQTVIPVRFGGFAETLSLEDWVRDGLMPVFFLVVGLEVKFEVLRGEFSSPRRLAVPIMAAIGGMAGPALVYLAINHAAGGAPGGWPIPTPTDVAFALAALAVFAPRLPQSLRLFLLTLAVADDLGAVVLIGLLFSGKVHVAAAAAALFILLALLLLSRWPKAPRTLFALGFLLIWGFTLRSGISTSVAGFACALTVPVGWRRPEQESVIKAFQDALHPYVAFAILPLFAFVSAGVALSSLPPDALLAPPVLGVALALILGKPLGVFGFTLFTATTRLGRKPLGATWPELFGVALLCGAGFTLSFFLCGLALAPSEQPALRLAVILGSLIPVLAGGLLLRRLQARREALGVDEDP
jgi:NhaA family Na+:H+ antiporter